VGGAMQEPKVKGQHHQHENIEEDPESEIVQAKILRPLFRMTEKFSSDTGSSGLAWMSHLHLASSIRTVSRITLPTISMLWELSLSTVSCGVCQKMLLYP